MDSCTAGSEHVSSVVPLLRTLPRHGIAEQREVRERLPEANSLDCSHDDAVVEDDPFDVKCLWLGNTKQVQVYTKNAPPAFPNLGQVDLVKACFLVHQV